LQEQFDNQENITYDKQNLNLDSFIVDMLDRFELLYGDKVENLRRMYNSNDLSSIFKLTDNEDLRKAVIEKNIYSIFRLSNADEDLRKAVVEENLYSIARLLPDIADEFKIIANDRHALWRVLEKYTNSKFVKPLKSLDNIDLDCFSRGQIASKKWLIEELKKVDKSLGTVFLCAGWYATLVPMLEEADIKFDKIRSFDIDKEVWKIAEVFNKDLVLDDWKFKATTQDIHDINYNTNKYNTVKSNGETEQLKDSPDTIINTSCEHIENFDSWYAKLPTGKLVILQSNNYFDIPEHVNCVQDISQFEQMTPMQEVYFTGELKLEKYTRYMRIGIR